MKTKKTIIIAIVGPSGSGKTTLSLYLNEYLRIPAICSYTTRPMRPGEKNGREHIFVKDFPHDPAETLAYTFFGGYHYWTMPEQVEGFQLCTYVIDEKGLLELKEKWSDKFEILSIYIVRPNNDGIDRERLDRDRDRICINPDEYDVTVRNDKDLNSFLRFAIVTIQKLLK